MKYVGRPSRHFEWEELESHEATPVSVPEALKPNAILVCAELERIRKACGDYPLHVTRCYSTPQHNASIPGAAPNSYHLQAMAADVVPPMPLMTTTDLARIIIAIAKTPESNIRYVKRYTGHVHFDIRPRRDLLVQGMEDDHG